MASGKLVNLRNAMIKWGDVIITQLKANIQRDKLVASSRLLQSVRFNDIKILGSKYSLEIVMENYWQYADQGRAGGKMPPIEPIMKWIAQKGIPIRQQVKAKKLKRKSKLTLSQRVRSQQKSLAFLIARNIAKKGTIQRFGYKGSGFASKYLNKSFEQTLKADISKAIKQDINVEIINAAK